MTIVEMIVNIDCPGCETKVKRALLKLDGVDNVDIDMGLQKVTVTGWAEQESVLKRVRKTGRKAELWPFDNPEYTDGFSEHYPELYTHHSHPEAYFRYSEQQPSALSNHNYNEHGNFNTIDGQEHSYYEQVQPLHYSSIFNNDWRANYNYISFSDEDTSACTIM